MGALIGGVWQVDPTFPTSENGAFVRAKSGFRNVIEADASATFPAVAGRYRLIVSYACPWAHRTLIARSVHGLASVLPVSVVHWFLGDQGWTFQEGPGVVPFPDPNITALHQLYTQARPDVTARVTVPVLWDHHTASIVNNESAEILRFLGPAFQHLAEHPGIDLTPADLVSEIDTINAHIYENVNNGVYRAGFARSQAAYDEAVHALFSALDGLESRLARQRWLLGDRFTEADIRLFTTLLRFEPVYVGHFKCNLRRLIEYPALWRYTLEIAQHPWVRPTIDLRHIKHHYYQSHPSVNPTRIVPAGPVLSWDEAVDRAHLGGRHVDGT